MMTPARQLAYHLLDLPLHKQVEIAQKFGVEWNLPELEQRIIKAAKAAGQVDVLWEEVESRHPQGDRRNNPYRQAEP